MTQRGTTDAAHEWFVKERVRHEGLTGLIQTTLASLLKAKRIENLGVYARTKTLESFLGKASKPKYKDPTSEIYDISAARIITFIESETANACALIRNTFVVHPEHSLDKTEELGIDRIGYRSVHFICEFGDDRCRLPEFEIYKGLKFEIQVRTVLQHAWAEIEHDRNYKLSGVLPGHIQRRLNLLAGMLELADREFDSIVGEIDAYSKQVSQSAKAGHLDVELDATSLSAYISTVVAGRLKFKLESIPKSGLTKVISEMRRFGINNLKDTDALFTSEFYKHENKHQSEATYVGLLRDAMMLSDLSRYFDIAYQEGWQYIDDKAREILTTKYGEEVVENTLRRHNIKPTPKDLE